MILIHFLQGSGTEDLPFRVQVNVCRGPFDYLTATSFTCKEEQNKSPINGHSTKLQSLETTMRQWGPENEIENFWKTLKQGSENLLRKIIEHENRLSDEDRGNVGAQTDVIGE